MKILAPLNDINYLEKFIVAGADEFYLGFYDNSWFDLFGKYSDINRLSGFAKYSNKYNFFQMIDVVKNIKDRGYTVYVTMNANTYGKDQIDYVEKNYLPYFIEAGVDGIIISDLALAKKIRDYNMPVIASTMCAVYNSDIAKVLQTMGIERMILPRDMSLDEIGLICRQTPSIEYEVFFMRNGCVFSDSFCLGMHGPGYESLCVLSRNCMKKIYTTCNERDKVELNDHLYNARFHNDACGMCALYRLNNMKIGALKIVGRVDNPDAICSDIEVTRKNLLLLEQCTSESDFLNKIQIPCQTVKTCDFGFSCYYPEVRF